MLLMPTLERQRHSSIGKVDDRIPCWIPAPSRREKVKSDREKQKRAGEEHWLFALSEDLVLTSSILTITPVS